MCPTIHALLVCIFVEEILIHIICDINYDVKFYEKVAFPLVENRVEGTPHPLTRSEHRKKAHGQRTWRNGKTGTLESIEVLAGAIRYLCPLKGGHD